MPAPLHRYFIFADEDPSGGNFQRCIIGIFFAVFSMSFFFISLLHLKRWRHWGMTLMKTCCGLFKGPEAAEDEDEYEYDYATQLRKKLARVKLSASERSDSGLDDNDRKKLARDLPDRQIAKTKTSKLLDSNTPRSVGVWGKIRRHLREYRERRLLRRTLATSSVKVGNTSSKSHSSQSTAQESMQFPDVSLQRSSKPIPEPTKNKAEPEITKSKSKGHDMYDARLARVHSAVNASPGGVHLVAGSSISVAAVVESDDEDEEEQTNGAPACVSPPRSSETTLRL